jgi:hypothetical protein
MSVAETLLLSNQQLLIHYPILEVLTNISEEPTVSMCLIYPGGHRYSVHITS